MRGRKPKPTSLQVSEGDPRRLGKGKLQERLDAEPTGARGLPDCPAHLRGRARTTWHFWKAQLQGMSLDCRPDAMMLEGACVNYARAVEADQAIAKDGLRIEEPILDKHRKVVGKRIRNHPLIAVSNAAWKLASSFCSDFGLSPISRTRLSYEKLFDAEDDLATILSKPRAPRIPPPKAIVD